MTRKSSALAAAACSLAFALAALAALAAPVAAGDAQTRRLEAIDAQRAALSAATRRLEGFAPEGTRVTAWRRAGRVVKIEVEMLGERSRRLQEYYWAGERLLAARVRIGDVATESQALPEDERMSFHAGLPQAWWREGRVADASGAAARTRAAELQAEARSFRRFVALPEPAGACLWSCADRAGDACRRFVCE